MRFYFLILDIALKYSGIEASVILRSKLFCNQLKLFPTFITCRYRSFHSQDFSELKRVGKINFNLENVNIYDILQDIDRKNLAVKADYFIDSDEREKSVPGYIDKKIFDSKGELKKYIVYHKKYNLLHFINHFEDKKIWRRDYYDNLGFLSSTQYIKDNKIYQQLFYRKNNSLALIKDYVYFDNNIKNIRIQILNEKNNFIRTVNSEEELTLYALNIYFNKNKESFSLIVDRNMFYYSLSIDLKKKFSKLDRKVFVIPVIHNMHIVVNNKTKNKRINSNYINVFDSPSLADVILTQTKLQEVEINENYNHLNAFSIPHSYEVDLTKLQNIMRDNCKVVYLARYSPDKNHDLAIRAFEIVVNSIPNAMFYCYGFGSLLPKLKELVISLNLEENIFLGDWVDDISFEYLSASLSFITSPSESFSLSIAESFAHGCPVVAFDVPYGPRELIVNGENGYLIPYSDINGIANKIIKIMQDKSLQLKLSRNAIESASSYSEKNVADRWIELFSNLKVV